MALRAWLHQWRLHRVLVRIRSDNLAALVGAARLKGKAGLILREISYVYTEASFEPALCEHIPGVCNVLADRLSRLHEPGASEGIPAQLAGVPATVIHPEGDHMIAPYSRSKRVRRSKVGCRGARHVQVVF